MTDHMARSCAHTTTSSSAGTNRSTREPTRDTTAGGQVFLCGDAPDSIRTLPRFDRAACEVLAADVSPAVAARFEADFLALLPSRLGRIEHAVTVGLDHEETITALVSLQASAVMIGAVRLAFTAQTALGAVSKAMHPSSLLPLHLRREAEQFVEAYASVKVNPCDAA
ncbi:hypothetical protein PTW37_15415 [Arthrobacter agilis]|uniref:hypothetical protein n=1 Tax=Arthrobacter agilis TaxID=37921 RepID=UPI002365FA89|nr:hypothetical protein [Arthrobacter agilis]WDF33215.1 hypothetical protein PTW37_15415 [Arthrobacter agilis]